MFQIRKLVSRLLEIIQRNRDFSGAIFTGYALTAASLGAQFILTPVYLDKLGQGEFGKLMMVLSFVNFVAIGIGWMSGGLTRIMGECWSIGDHSGFRQAHTLGRWVFTGYALIISLVGLSVWAILARGNQQVGEVPLWAILAALYLLASYESNPDRQAYVAMCKQAQGNIIEGIRVLIFAVMTFALLPFYPQIELVLLAYLVGVLVQRALMSWRLRKIITDLRWRMLDDSVTPLFLRLAGKQGVQYVAFGALLLAMQSDILIVGFLAGPDIAAKFAVLWKIPEALSLILWRIPSAMEPHIVRMDANRDYAGIVKTFTVGRPYFIGVVLTSSIAFAFLGPFLARLWVGDFAPDENWMYWLAAAAMFFLTVARWPISVAYALIKLKPIIIIGLTELLGKIVLVVVLLPHLSYAAPLAATVIVHVIAIGWAYQLFLKIEQVH